MKYQLNRECRREAGNLIVGILALQGGFHLHQLSLESLQVESELIRYPKQLGHCNALILPGGESTTLMKQIVDNDFIEPLIEFATDRSIMGTCAGMIISSCTNHNSLSIIDIDVDRNAWGRQLHSFESEITVNFESKRPFNATFIRAPKVTRMGNGIQSLAKHEDSTVLLSDGKHLMASFHPEIGNDNRIHKLFMGMI